MTYLYLKDKSNFFHKITKKEIIIPTFFKVNGVYDFNAISDMINHVTFFNESKILQY